MSKKIMQILVKKRFFFTFEFLSGYFRFAALVRMGKYSEATLEVNDLIKRLLSVGNPEKGLTKTVKEHEIFAICCKSF
jgi:hypothetical protein